MITVLADQQINTHRVDQSGDRNHESLKPGAAGEQTELEDIQVFWE